MKNNTKPNPGPSSGHKKYINGIKTNDKKPRSTT